jgi:hypothetical protein
MLKKHLEWHKKMDMNSENPFQQRLMEKQSRNPFEKRSEEINESSESLWDSVMDFAFSSEETPFEYGLASAARGILPAVAGIPGDIIQTIKLLGSKEPKNKIQEYGRKILESFPTSQQLQEKYDVTTEGKYQPKSEQERFFQETGGDIASLLIPVTKASSALKAVGVGIGSNLVKEGVKNLGAGETSQTATKLGSMFLFSMFNPNGAKKFATNLYQKASSELPKNAMISTENFSKNLRGLENELSRGLKNIPSKAPVINAIEDVQRNIKEGHININDLTEAKRNLNEQRTIRIYDPEIVRDKKVKTDLKKNYGRLSNIIDDAISQYGKKNKEFYKYYQDANKAWAGIEQSKKGSQFLKRHLGNYKFQSGLGLAAELLFYPSAIPATVATIGTGYAGLKSYELMNRILMNPVLRKYYIKSVMEAVKEDAPVMIKNIKKLDEEMKKQDFQ